MLARVCPCDRGQRDRPLRRRGAGGRADDAAPEADRERGAGTEGARAPDSPTPNPGGAGQENTPGPGQRAVRRRSRPKAQDATGRTSGGWARSRRPRGAPPPRKRDAAPHPPAGSPRSRCARSSYPARGSPLGPGRPPARPAGLSAARSTGPACFLPGGGPELPGRRGGAGGRRASSGPEGSPRPPGARARRTASPLALRPGIRVSATSHWRMTQSCRPSRQRRTTLEELALERPRPARGAVTKAEHVAQPPQAQPTAGAASGRSAAPGPRAPHLRRERGRPQPGSAHRADEHGRVSTTNRF